MFAHILVPTDFGGSHEHALDVGARMVGPDGGHVTLLHVIETLDLPFEDLADFYARLESEAHQKMDALARPLRDRGIPVTNTVTFGKRAPEIVREATENDVDLIVMASHQVDPTDRAARWMTISHQVAMFAPCPVLLLR